MTATNEDREAAIAKLLETRCLFGEDDMAFPTVSPIRREAELLLEALVSHGWGPKPRVSRAWVEESIDCCGASAILEGLAASGIEVTD